MDNKTIFFNVCEYLYLRNDNWAPTRIFQEALLVLGIPNDNMAIFFEWALQEKE